MGPKQQATHDKTPSIPIVCFGCAWESAKEDNPEGLAVHFAHLGGEGGHYGKAASASSERASGGLN